MERVSVNLARPATIAAPTKARSNKSLQVSRGCVSLKLRGGFKLLGHRAAT
jgi:hypothetical protein